MVHRPSDSRLLVNLISHEKDYTKQLATLLEHSQASLASFSAYASASSPPTSQIIIQVAGALAGADEGLRKYAASLEIWQDQLKSLKNLEDEVGNVMRDREILVTRLIKAASKNQKSTRDTILATSGSSSTLSIVKPEVQIGSKLAAAQGELQACEAHLASKERELDLMRTQAVRTGLQARCKALVECGWQWGEMGKEGLRALETLDIPNGMNGHAHPSGQLPYNKPLPDSGQSDLSSIGPSQSASQNTHPGAENPSPPRPYTLHIPPAHSISDVTFPNGTSAPLEQVDEDGSSSADEEEGQFEVRENERFSLRRNGQQAKDRSPSKSSKLSSSASAPQVVTRSKPRQRQNSGMFASISAFFHGSKSSNAGSDDERNPYVPESYATVKSGSRWKSRTDKNLSKRRNSSDDDLPVAYPRTLPPDPISTGQMPATADTSASASSQRLKKKASKRNTMQGPPKASTSALEDRGWASDNPAPVQRNGTLKAKKKTHSSAVTPNTPAPGGSGIKSKKGKEVEILHINGEPATGPSPSSPSLSKGKKPNGTALSATLPTEASLSRNSSISKHSITSAASAPVNSTVHPTPATVHRSRSAHQRSTSLDNSHPRPGPDNKATPKRTTPNAVYVAPRASGEPSLMSIVEGVARQNREFAQKQDPNRMLFLPKAPPPASQHPDLVRPAPPRLEREASERSVPLTPSVPAAPAPVVHQPSSPEMKPLRSALRNSSRSPSPQLTLPVPGTAPAVPARSPLRPLAKLDDPDDGDDVSSISSYETTRSTLLDDDDEALKTPVQTHASPLPTPTATPTATPTIPPPALPPKEAKNGSDVSQSTGSSTAAPTRRKSVRMSLPPTFSPTPPALEEADEGVQRRFEPWAAPASSGGKAWTSRIRETRDVWADSSEDEDEEYSAAKRLLTRFGRKS